MSNYKQRVHTLSLAIDLINEIYKGVSDPKYWDDCSGCSGQKYLTTTTFQ